MDLKNGWDSNGKISPTITYTHLVFSPRFFCMFGSMKIFNLVFCVLFVLSAGLQYNDPDPYIWMPIYLYGATLCWLAFRGKYYPTAYIAGIIIYIGYALYLFFAKDGVLDWIRLHQAENIAETMKATKPWIEETREFFALVILIVVLAVDFFYAKRKRDGPLEKVRG
jgi:Transmembrane family 220, helix